MREVEVGGAGPGAASASITSRPRRTGNWFKVLSIILIGSLCPALFAAEQGVMLVGAGSSVPLPLYLKWADLYNQNNRTVQLQYVAMGTIEGIAQITHGTSDFGAGEVPLTVEERRLGNLTELPVVLIGIVPIFNLPGIPNLRLSGDVLAEVYLGHISHWNDPAIVKLNPGIALPSLPIRIIYRPAGKGSNYVFTEYLSKVNARFRDQVGKSASPKWPVGQPAERSSDMADKVKSTPGALGYVELQYADDNRITHASMLNAAGKFVKATAASITAACTAVEAPGWDKLSASLTNPPGADSYPISSFTWLYVRPSARDQRRTAALVGLLNWAFSDGQSIAIEEGYSDLPKPLVVKVLAKINAMR
ncbi:MAG: phosphate ABC transporter substrate-binding protein PstS [Acidobacteriia bacterium]|nr:phosphate ABC transporter substrate-binding protein PstS [Terriglobia bacterium]